MSDASRNSDLIQGIVTVYDRYREQGLSRRRISRDTLMALIKKNENLGRIQVETAGTSLEGRDVFHLKTGKGPIQVLMWSQMHGDEPTATMALFDLLSFLGADDEYNDVRELIQRQVTLHIVPVLNPDGAALFQRRTPAGIDLNRDALALQSPESRLLKRLVEEIKPEFAFNLHDQSTRYSVGETNKHTMIAFLAPPADPARTVTVARKKSMKLIAHLYKRLSALIPGYIAAYSDEFEPRAFGDTIQQWGYSTVLVESGGHKDDPEKQEIRKLNMVLLAEALRTIAADGYHQSEISDYSAIPPNTSRICDVILRNAWIQTRGGLLEVDIAVNRLDLPEADGTGFETRGVLFDVGDLSVYFGYEEMDVSGAVVTPGRGAPEVFSVTYSDWAARANRLLQDGITAIRIEQEALSEEIRQKTGLRLMKPDELYEPKLIPESETDLVVSKDGRVVFGVIGGKLVRPVST